MKSITTHTTILLLIINCSYSFSQQSSPDSVNKNEILTYVEQMPEFPGGQTELVKFLSSNLQYPDSARHNNIEGKVVAHFVVNEDGSISDPQILKGLGYGCDEEVLRVISMMPKWNPGKLDGKPVSVYFNLPVTFKLGEYDPTKANISTPSYPGGDDSLKIFIQKNLQYPKDAKKKKIEGVVVLQFDVTMDGNAENISVYTSLGSGCDEEAIRILKLIPHWNPGQAIFSGR